MPSLSTLYINRKLGTAPVTRNLVARKLVKRTLNVKNYGIGTGRKVPKDKIRPGEAIKLDTSSPKYRALLDQALNPMKYSPSPFVAGAQRAARFEPYRQPRQLKVTHPDYRGQVSKYIPGVSQPVRQERRAHAFSMNQDMPGMFAPEREARNLRAGTPRPLQWLAARSPGVFTWLRGNSERNAADTRTRMTRRARGERHIHTGNPQPRGRR